MTYWYLGSPYSKYPGEFGADPALQAAAKFDAAHKAVCREAALLIKAGILIYSPIAHCHPIAIIGDIDPSDSKMWIKQQRPMMNVARGLIVLMLNGWMVSEGLMSEIAIFLAAGKPLIYMRPGLVPSELMGPAE